MSITHKFVTVDADGTGDGSQASPWTLEQAVMYAYRGNIVWVKQGRYVLTSGLSIGGSGSVLYNEPVTFIGYHTSADTVNIVSDMDAGGIYYQPVIDCLRNGVDTQKCVEIDASDGDFSILNLDGSDYSLWRNFYLHNNNRNDDNDAVYLTESATFVNCRFDDVDKVLSDSTNEWVAFIGCYMGDQVKRTAVAFNGTDLYMQSCVVNGKTSKVGVSINAGRGHIKDCIIIKGYSAINGGALSTYILCENNTFYDIETACLIVHGTSNSFAAFNNVGCVLDTGYYIKRSTSGGSYFGDYNCWFGTSTPVWDQGAGGTVPQFGPNSIFVDPDFVDAVNFDFRPRNPAVLRGGRPEPVQSMMGAVRQQYQFPARAGCFNPGRMSIIR